MKKSQIEIQKNVTDADLLKLNEIHKVAQLEGWDIFESWRESLEYEIQGYHGEIFNNDIEAVRFVFKKALEGSEIHNNALEFMIKYGTPAELEFIITSVNS